MKVKIQKWGNSLAFRIPRTLAQEADIRQGSTIDLGVLRGRLVVSSVKKKYLLRNLLMKVTKSNIHREVDFPSF